MDGFDVGTLFATLVLDDQMSTQLLGVGNTFSQVGSQMTQAGLGLTAGITAPLTALVYASVNAGVEFESAMNQIQGVLRPTAAEMEALRETALQMGKDTVFSATDAATAMLELGKAGFTTKEAIDSVDEVLTLAAASSLSMGEAAELSARALNAFGLETEDLSHVNDVLAKAVNTTSLEIDDLATAFKYIGPLAQGVGLSIEMASAAIGIMRDNGVAAETAGRALREAFDHLLNPTAAVTEAIAQLGVNLYDANGALLPFDQIIQELEPHANNTGAILKLFGDAAGPGMAALIREGADSLRTLTQGLVDSEGAAKSMADAMMQGLPGALEYLKGEINTLFITISKELEGPLRTVFGVMESGASFITNTVIPAFAALPEPVQTFLIVLAGLAAAIGPVLVAFGAMAASIGALITLFSGPVGVAIGLFVGTLTTMLIPLGLVAAGIAAIVAAGAGLKYVWDILSADPMDAQLPTLKEFSAETWEAAARNELLAHAAANAEAGLAELEAQERANAAAAAEAAAAQEAYNQAVQGLVDKFSGAGLLETARQYEDALKNQKVATSLTRDEQEEFAKVFQAVIDKYEQFGPKGQAVVDHYTQLLLAIQPTIEPLRSLTYELTTFGNGMIFAGVNTDGMTQAAAENMNVMRGLTTEGLIPATQNTLVLSSALTAMPIPLVNQQVSETITWFDLWGHEVLDIANSLLYLGSVIPGVMGSILTFAGTALNAFLSITNAISTIKTSWSTMSTAFSGGFSLGGISSFLGGMTSIIGAVGTAVQLVSALGSAIKRAFTSEETELVNPNRDLFTSQFIGAETDPFLAIANSTIRAAMQVYGVDWDTAWAQYAEPLILALQDADTYAEFKNAQLAIGELFRQAGITLSIYDEAGNPTQYRSGVFDTGVTYTGPLPTSTTDIASFGQTYTTQVGTAVTGAYNTGTTSGGSTFQTGTGTSMGGACIQIGTLNLYGANAEEMAKAFFKLLAQGGEVLGDFRDVICVASPA